MKYFKYIMILIISLLLIPCGNKSQQKRIDDLTNKEIETPLINETQPSDNSSLLIPYEKDGKWGYCDKNKTMIIEPQFDDTEPFSYGTAFVKKRGLTGVIDKKGNWVLSPQFDIGSYAEYQRYFDGLAIVGYHDKNGNMHKGYVNMKKRLVIPMEYFVVNNFENGMAVVRKTPSKCGVINKNGEWVAKPIFDYASIKFIDGLSRNVNDSDKWGFVDTAGNWIIDPTFDFVDNFSEGLAGAKINDKWGYINRDGEWVIKPQFFSASQFKRGIAIVGMNGKMGCIDDKGKWVILPKFDLKTDSDDSIIWVRKKDKYGFYDTMENILVQPKYDEHWGFNEGVSSVRIGDKWGCINTKGTWVIDPKYDYLWSFFYHLAMAKQNDKYFYIDKNGTEYWGKDVNAQSQSNHVSQQHKPTNASDEELFIEPKQKENSKFWGYVDEKDNWLVLPKYTMAGSFENGYALVKENNELFYIDEGGKAVSSRVSDSDFYAHAISAPSQGRKKNY